MVRDGRSTAASVIAERWGPDDPSEAITWWETRMRRAHEGLEGVAPESVLVMSLEDLVVLDRNAPKPMASVSRLCIPRPQANKEQWLSHSLALYRDNKTEHSFW